jgi:hypothetical protein
MRGDDHVLVPASGQEAQDIVGGSAGDRPESVVPGAAGGKEAGGGELPGDARLRVDGARRAGGRPERRLSEKNSTRVRTAVFGGDRLSVARADDIPLGWAAAKVVRASRKCRVSKNFPFIRPKGTINAYLCDLDAKLAISTVI